MTSLPTSFTLILATLRALVAAHAAKDRARAPFLVLVWGAIGRAATRFERLYARWQAGTLAPPRPSRAGQPRQRSAAPRPPPPHLPRLPTSQAWLLRHVQPAAVSGCQLQNLLATPELAEFLRAAPHAARILRPLCRMLGITPLPPPLQPPPRAPRPRIAKPAIRPHHPEPPPPRPLPRYVRAAARAWRTKPA